MVFMACETDFEVNTSWKEVTIVYGLLDQSEAQQYIKINKAFLGEGDAFQMASVADSINYNPEDLEVIIYKVKEGAYDTIGFVTLDTTTSIIKDDGLFSTEKNIIYVTTKEDSNFFMANNAKDKEYILTIVNKKTQKIVSAKSNLIHTLNLDNNSLMKMGFYSSDVLNPGATPPYKKVTTTVNWKHSTNGYIYQIIGKICYRNYYNNGSNSLEYLDWIQPTQKYDGSSDMHYTFEGDAFANFISAYMPAMQDDIDYRKLAYMKLQYTVGSEDLHTYMVVNEPFEGIVQERPVFTNINNGIGLFSCRYNEIEIIQFSEATSKGLSLEFSNLGFN
tara:strand:- start:234 stop:1232 length:999 start_codon:yes stop_codon:yes gene_type:complete